MKSGKTMYSSSPSCTEHAGFRQTSGERSRCPLFKHVQRDPRCGRRSFLGRRRAFARGDRLRLWLTDGLKLAAVDTGLAQVNFEVGGPGQGTLDQRLAERILDVLLKSPAQRPRAVAAVGAGFLQNVPGGVLADPDLDLLGHQI